MLIFESEDVHIHADTKAANKIADAIYELGEAYAREIANITGYSSKKVIGYMMTLTYTWYVDNGVKYRLAEHDKKYSWQPAIPAVERMEQLWK